MMDQQKRLKCSMPSLDFHRVGTAAIGRSSAYFLLVAMASNDFKISKPPTEPVTYLFGLVIWFSSLLPLPLPLPLFAAVVLAVLNSRYFGCGRPCHCRRHRHNLHIHECLTRYFLRCLPVRFIPQRRELEAVRASFVGGGDESGQVPVRDSQCLRGPRREGERGGGREKVRGAYWAGSD